jgi:outer membrane lipoprotein LolB
MRPCFWLAILLLAGCASRPPLTDAPPDRWHDHAGAALAWQAWELQGRVALRLGEEGWHGSLHWQQYADAYRIQISGPFGQGGIQLDAEGGLVRLRQGERIALATDAETLMQQELGWSLPLGGLGHWVRGVPRRPEAASLSFDADGRLARLREAGWVVDYQRYDEGLQPPMPDRIRLEHEGLRVRLVVDRWQRLPRAGASGD